ncbi:MAG: DegV family protein, partial [Firmicutes bacterium]|nr:DegV family protein [Bacillota bacterium]
YPRTSLPSPNDYMEKFLPYAKEGRDILCVCITSKFSGSYQSAVTACNLLKEEYPNVNIEIVYSLQGQSAQGLLVYQAGLMREAGFSLKETAERLNIIRHDGEVIFSVSDLSFLVHGGRLGKAAGLVGSILKIQPIIAIKTGELMPYSKVRGVKKALKEIVDIAMKNVGENKDDYIFALEDTTRKEDLEVLRQMMLEQNIELFEPATDIGVCISAHSGPNTVGVSYLKKYDRV